MIAPGVRVTLHFAIELEDGTLVDGNFDRAPASFRVGDGTLPEGFERCLLGLRAGDERRFRLAPEQAFGRGSPANVMTLPRQRFAAALNLEPGLVVDFAAAAGSLPGVIKAVEGDRVLVDFNHPLAGRTLVFAVAIRAVAQEAGS
jgi:FKBP-type peptidyl-prolyl cis-trans isomerase SlpA